MSDHFEAYRSLRDRVVALVDGLDHAALGARVPATPEWSVHELLAHLVGVTSDVVAGRLEGVATDPWTAVQVDVRRTATVAGLLAEWEQNLAPLEELVVALPPEITGQLVLDAASHEHDLRHALAAPGACDSTAVDVAFWWMCEVATADRPGGLRLETERGAQAFGRGAPEARVRAPRFELLRAITGRRSFAQIAALDWDPAPRAELLVVSPPFSARDDDLVEVAS